MIKNSLKFSPLVRTILLFVFIFAWYGAFATFGTGNFLQQTLGTPFDSLALSILKGRAWVPDGALIYENVRIAPGQNVMYFGPFPALLRLPILVVFPSVFGKLSPLLCTLAGVLCALAFFRLFTEAEKRSEAPFRILSPRILTLLFALASPITYLVSVPTIYQEATLWGVCFSLWSLAIAYRALRNGWSTKSLFLLSACIGGALLARLTFALPLLGVIFAAVVFVFCYQGNKLLSWANFRRLAIIALPLVIAGSIQMAYNYGRFGSPFTVMQQWDQYEMETPAIAAARARLGTYNAGRIPNSLIEYLGVFGHYLSPKFPFISPWTPDRPQRPPLYFNDSGEAMLPISLASPVLVVFALLGALSLVRGRFSPLTFAALLFLVQVGLICSYYFITFRYNLEFLPLIVILTLAVLESRMFKTSRALQFALLAVGLLSIATMTLTTFRVLIYQTGIPETYRQAVIRTIGSGR